jgi:hypothetical protein
MGKITLIRGILCPYCKYNFKEKRYMERVKKNVFYCSACKLRLEFMKEDFIVRVSRCSKLRPKDYEDYDLMWYEVFKCEKCNSNEVFYVANFNRSYCLNCFSNT